MNMREVTFRGRDVAFSFLVSVPLGAIAAAAVGAIISLGSPLIWSVALVAAILGLALGPVAAVGGGAGYRLARAGKLRSRWLFSAVVALGSGIIMDILIVCLTGAEMGSFVSETIDGHPSNPWLDSLPLYPALFVAGFVPAYLWFAGYASFRHRQAIRARMPSDAGSAE